jgi:predicted DNA-binding protein (MmcQ/YjbR family)
MPKTLDQAVRDVCLWLPESEEFVSHGAPNFRVRKGRIYATYAANVHGDGRVALWLKAPAGAQAHHVKSSPKHFFVPPYVGPSGWLGVMLDKGLSWQRIAELVREAYLEVAPPKLAATLGKTPKFAAPTEPMKAEVLDPYSTPRGKQLLEGMRKIGKALPEVSESRQFGSPVWQAGKKSFVYLFQDYEDKNRWMLGFWCGIPQQGMLTTDPRYKIPKYMGHKGWISLDVTRHANWNEVRALAEQSYRHFALRRMLAKLPPED